MGKRVFMLSLGESCEGIAILDFLLFLFVFFLHK